MRILENLVPALKTGYSRVLLNEIVVSEEMPTLAATTMDIIMLAHFAVREDGDRMGGDSRQGRVEDCENLYVSGSRGESD